MVAAAAAAEDCAPCGLGYRQNPVTCECKNYFVKEASCPSGFDLVHSKCHCERDGDSKRFKPNCRRGYTLDDDCQCFIDNRDKKIMCPSNQYWDEEFEQCLLKEAWSGNVSIKDGRQNLKQNLDSGDKEEKYHQNGYSYTTPYGVPVTTVPTATQVVTPNTVNYPTYQTVPQ